MTALLSSRNAGEVRAFPGAKSLVEPAAHPLETECARLRTELAEARDAIASLQHESERAIGEALEQGRRDGLAQAASREADRLAVLESALANAAGIFDRKLAGLDRLAAELAAVALARLLDDPAALTQLSASFVARQVQELKSAAIVRVHVGSADFDDAALAVLGARLREAGAGIEIVQDVSLAPGQARFDCTLGRADLDLGRQWQSLTALLRDMAKG